MASPRPQMAISMSLLNMALSIAQEMAAKLSAPSRPGINGSFWGMMALGDSVLAYGMRGNVWRSDNRGRSWRKLDTGGSRQSFQDGLRFSNGTIILVGLNGGMAISRDNGKSFCALTRAERKGYASLAEGANDNIILFGEAGIQQTPRLDRCPR